MDIFVNAAANPNKSDGSSANPFVTITDALKALQGAARVAGVTDRILVLPGTYNEVLAVSISDVSLEGSTLLTTSLGLPTGAVAGTETIIQPMAGVGAPAAMLTVAPSALPDSAGSERLRNVSISGFVIRNVDGTALGVAFDRVRDFEVRGNVIQGWGTGCYSRLSSGLIQGNYFPATNPPMGHAILVGGGVGFMPFATASIWFPTHPGIWQADPYPAHVSVSGNAIDQCGLAGIAISGGGHVDLDGVLLPFDVAANKQLVSLGLLPMSTVATVVGNKVTACGRMGIEIIGFALGYPNNVPFLSAVVWVDAGGNEVTGTQYLGIAVSAGYTALPPPPLPPQSFFAAIHSGLTDNEVSGSGQADYFAGFSHPSVVIWKPANLDTTPYLQNSRFSILMDDWNDLEYDNPACPGTQAEAAAGATPVCPPAAKPLGNMLWVIDDTGMRVLFGRHIS